VKTAVAIAPTLLRPREAAAVLAVSVRQIETWARAGRLTPVKIPGIRATRFARQEVEELAQSWIAAAARS
jgi:excisionase family DNA binding protein